MELAEVVFLLVLAGILYAALAPLRRHITRRLLRQRRPRASLSVIHKEEDDGDER